MKKCALFMPNNFIGCKYKNIYVNKVYNYIASLIKGTKKIILNDEKDEIEINIFEVFCTNDYNSNVKRLKKAFELLAKERIELVAFDEYLINNYEELITQNASTIQFDICYGTNLYIMLVFKLLKKLFKTKGIDINNLEMAINSKEFSNKELAFINCFAPNIKFLAYINNTVREDFLDNIYNEYGFPIRICKSMYECIREVDLFINIKGEKVDFNRVRTNKNIIIFDMNNEYHRAKKNVTILKSINIDIRNKFILPELVSRENTIKICEMYLLLMICKWEALDNNLSENDLEEMYNCFISS